MTIRIGLAVLAALLVNTASADSPTDDLVTVRGDKLRIDEVSLCSVTPLSMIGIRHTPVKFQVKTHAEAQRNVVSRDYFVSITTMYWMAVRQDLARRGGGSLDAVQCDEIPELIGNPDLVVNIYMTKGGVQLETTATTTGETSRVTQTWEDLGMAYD